MYSETNSYKAVRAIHISINTQTVCVIIFVIEPQFVKSTVTRVTKSVSASPLCIYGGPSSTY